MKKLHIWIAVVIVGIIGIGITLLLLIDSSSSLTFRVRDEVSKGWVWDMRATIDDRTLRGFFQSDQGLIDYHFTHLKGGKQKLIISAPYYEEKIIEVDLKKGENVIEEPIDLIGIEIPDLYKFYAFEREEDDAYLITFRPVTKENSAITLHPALNIWIGTKVRSWNSELEESISVFDKQSLLYKGSLEWTWDSYPETQFRYIASLPFSKIKEGKETSYAIEYLVVAPNLKKITSKEFESITTQLEMMDDEKIGPYIDSLGDKISYYSDISYDVRRTR
ncbi:MAG: hypothetical protein EOM67_05775 [Spirochaetia bacterium]|nr:hypothetical protein [Spirochaetia bacterium]